MLVRMATLVLFTSSATAQAAYEYITPTGAEFFEGNGSSNIMLGSLGTSCRVQQVDNNLVGNIAPVISFIGWRRNDAARGGAGGSKRTDLSVTMSHANFNNVTTTFDSNPTDTPVVVFAQRTVSLPSWDPSVPLEAFVTRLPLDQPFSYNGTDALLWDVKKDNDPGTSYSQDWINAMPTEAYGALPEPLSGGCTTTNGTMLHRVGLRTDGTTLDFGFRVQGAPSSANVGLFIGFSNLNAPNPDLCANLATNPLITLPSIGTASIGGAIRFAFTLSAPWTANSFDVPLYSQAFALDASQSGLPVALSGGLLTRTPAMTSSNGTNVWRLYDTTSSSALTGILAQTAAPTIYGL